MLAAGLGAALLGASEVAAGGLYRYVDERGIVHFTDAPSDGRFEKVRIGPTGAVRRAPPPRLRQTRVYDHVIAEAARAHDVPPALVKAMVAAESNFDPRAVSPKGARGLMQLMPETAELVGVANPFGPEENVHGGVRYLRWLLDRYGDWTRALAAYNAGPSAVDRHRGVPPYRETRAYVRRVLEYYRRYHGDFVP